MQVLVGVTFEIEMSIKIGRWASSSTAVRTFLSSNDRYQRREITDKLMGVKKKTDINLSELELPVDHYINSTEITR